MRRHWWKVLGVLLVVYGIVAGMLVPLKPNLAGVSPRSAQLGDTVTLTVTGYNTNFANKGPAGGMVSAWLLGGDSTDLAVRASAVEILDDRRARLTFALPPHLPELRREKKQLALYVNSPADGAFVDPQGVFVRQTEPAANQAAAEAPWRVTAIQKGDLIANPDITFPYRGHLAESIRNTYFHVSLWFAMMFVLLAAMVYAIKYLRRSGSPDGPLVHESTRVVSRRDQADYWSVAFTSVGMLFGVLGLITGAVWAKYTWGAYWTWDIKQVTTLIALLIYAGYFVLRASFPDPEQRARLGAAYNIFAFACLIPLLYVLPRLSGNSLHPGAAGNPAFGGEDLDNTMRMVFYPIIIGWTLIGFWMAGVGYRARKLRERLLLLD